MLPKTPPHGPNAINPARIEVPVQLWHGEKDTSAPPAHGHWLAERIPGVDAHFPDDDDHASIEMGHQQEAYEWLWRRVS
jgi:pimeloyl-ACP methyl ester carboxylesterase